MENATDASEVKLNLLREAIGGGEEVWVVVRGRSMGPHWEGARVRLGRLLWLLPGDLVVFVDEGGNLVLHRWLGAVWLPGRGVRHLTQGDAAPREDGWFRSAMLVGRVVEVKGELGAFVVRGGWPVNWRARVGAVGRGLAAIVGRVRRRV